MVNGNFAFKSKGTAFSSADLWAPSKVMAMVCGGSSVPVSKSSRIVVSGRTL